MQRDLALELSLRDEREESLAREQMQRVASLQAQVGSRGQTGGRMMGLNEARHCPGYR